MVKAIGMEDGGRKKGRITRIERRKRKVRKEGGAT